MRQSSLLSELSFRESLKRRQRRASSVATFKSSSSGETLPSLISMEPDAQVVLSQSLRMGADDGFVFSAVAEEDVVLEVGSGSWILEFRIGLTSKSFGRRRIITEGHEVNEGGGKSSISIH